MGTHDDASLIVSEVPHAYGHILSTKSTDLDRDTFFFITLIQKSQLFLGVNQKFTPVTSATIHRWVDLMNGHPTSEQFFLCPVIVHSAGVMSYYVRPSGPAIEPDSEEPLPPGNYGWYFDQKCTMKGFPELSSVREHVYTFEAGVAESIESESVVDPFPRSAMARENRLCGFTGSAEGTVLAWIIPPVASWMMDDFGDPTCWDKTPFLVDGNVLTMRESLVFYLHRNHFTVDVDDDYRILVLRRMGDEQRLLPTHFPRQDAATEHFLRLHCRYSLNLMLLGGDIGEVYPNSKIVNMMDALGVDYIGKDDHEESETMPLTGERWHTPLGNAILANVLDGRTARGVSEFDRLASGSNSPASRSDSFDQAQQSADLGQWSQPPAIWGFGQGDGDSDSGGEDAHDDAFCAASWGVDKQFSWS